MRILLCDDDSDQLELINRHVQRMGHTTVLASNGSEAWSYLSDVEFDVVITDWFMPGPDGLELCRRVRNRGPGPYTYLIVLTALGETCDLSRTMRAGADDYIQKPLRCDELEARLIAAQRVCDVYASLAKRQCELVLLNKRVREQARTDPLTELSNRLRLIEDLDALACRADRYGTSHAFVLADIDHFKLYNDHYGHLEGDEVLRRIARTLRMAMRASDVAYRYGGEEFLAILSGQGPADVLRGVERIQSSIEKLGIEHRKSPFGVVTTSVGVAIHEPGANPNDTIDRADTALYRAKEAGRNRTIIFNNSMRTEHSEAIGFSGQQLPR